MHYDMCKLCILNAKTVAETQYVKSTLWKIEKNVKSYRLGNGTFQKDLEDISFFWETGHFFNLGNGTFYPVGIVWERDKC